MNEQEQTVTVSAKRVAELEELESRVIAFIDEELARSVKDADG